MTRDIIKAIKAPRNNPKMILLNPVSTINNIELIIPNCNNTFRINENNTILLNDLSISGIIVKTVKGIIKKESQIKLSWTS
jgi:hypothetical protein